VSVRGTRWEGRGPQHLRRTSLPAGAASWKMEYQRRLCLMRFAPSTVAYGRAYRCTPPPRRLRGRRCAPQLWGQRAGRRADAAWAGRAAKTKAAGRRRSMKTSPRSRFSAPPPPPVPLPRTETPAVSSLEAEGALSAPCPYAWVSWLGTARTRPPWRMTPLPGALRAGRSPGAALQRAPRSSDGVGRPGRRRAPDRGERPRPLVLSGHAASLTPY